MSTKKNHDIYKERFLETSFFLNHHSKVDNELVLMNEVLWAKKFPVLGYHWGNMNIYDNFEHQEEVSLNDANLTFLARLLDPESLIFKLYWPSIAESYLESTELTNSLDTSQYVQILKILEGQDNELFKKFKEHLSVNGFLKQSSGSIFLNNSDLKLRNHISGKGVLKFNEELVRKITSSDYNTIFDAILLLQGISPRKGLGREYKNLLPSNSDLDYLIDNDLITDLSKHIKEEFKDSSGSFEEELKERLVEYLSPRTFNDQEQHLSQLALIIDELDYLIRKLSKMHSTFSEDQLYLHKNSLEALLQLNAEIMMTSNPDFHEKVVQGHEFWSERVNRTSPEFDFISAFGSVSRSKNINDGGFYTVIINALYYLFYSLQARQMMVSAERYDYIDVTFLSLLAGFSTDRTIKNDLTRKNTLLNKRNKGDMHKWSPYGDIEIKSALQWLRNDKRKLKFKEIVCPEDLNTNLDYNYLKDIYEGFCHEYRTKHETPFSETKKLAREDFPEVEYLKNAKYIKNPPKLMLSRENKAKADFVYENKDGSKTFIEIKKHLKTRDRILNALNRNKHKKTKSELELLEKFYAESETYKRI